MSQAEYLEYLKGIASQIDESDLPQEYRPVALQLMAKHYFYAKTEGTDKGNVTKKEGKPTGKMLVILQERRERKKGNKESQKYVAELGPLSELSFDEASDAIDRIKEIEGWKVE